MNYKKLLVDSALGIGEDLRKFCIEGWGLERDKCLSAINTLSNNNIPILGGDVYVITSLKATPTHDNWYCERLYNESISAFASRSAIFAHGYVSSYPESNSANTLFVLVPFIN